MKSGAEDAKASPRSLSAQQLRSQTRWMAMQIVVVYAIVGAVWIVASDYVLASLITDHDVLSRAQTYKGWAYIAVTAALLGLLVMAYLRRVELSQQIVRESEQRFQTLARATNDALWVWDLATNDLWWNEGVQTQLGYRPTETAGGIQWWYDKIHHGDRDRVVAKIHAVINSGQVEWRDEYRHRRSDGSYAEVQDRGRVIHDETGKPVRMIGGITDITSRKRAEQLLRERFEREQLLLQELDHRVRNNLAALLSLVDMTRRSAGDVNGFADRISGRVRALGNVHSLLSDSHWGALGLRSLITAVAPAESIKQISVEGEDVAIPSRQVTGLAMVLHELMANSVKHGALSTLNGALHVQWVAFAAHGNTPPTVELHWREQGGPRVNAVPSPSVGFELVNGLTRSELGGEAKLTFPPGGADHMLIITLDHARLVSATLDVAARESEAKG